MKIHYRGEKSVPTFILNRIPTSLDFTDPKQNRFEIRAVLLKNLFHVKLFS